MRIAIVCKGNSRKEAPKAGWDFWGLPTDPQADRFDLIFEMHKPGYWKQWPGHFEKLAGFGPRLVVRGRYDGLPQAIPYPDAAHFPRDYFLNSVCYMIAMAVLCRPPVIGLWGCDHFDYDQTESLKQWRCVDYWLGVAEGRGIEIVTPEGSPLLRGSYGD